jgi:GT2 family glycosyltransferase
VAERLTACVVNFNGERYLERSIGAVMGQGERIGEILLVDNASEDGSLELVRTRFPGVRVHRRAANEGPAAARNDGYRIAACDRILFLDNDMVLADAAAARLADALDRDPDAAIAVPRILYGNHPDVVQFDGAECHFLGGMVLHHAEWADADVPVATRKIGSLGAGCFLVDRRRLRIAQPFDESFRFNYEDHDFGVHVRVTGHTILAVSAARCYHLDGTPGLSMRPGGRYASTRVYEWPTLLLLAPMLAVYEVAQLGVVIGKGWLREWCTAAGWIVGNLPAILERRRAVQRGRRIPDRRLLASGPLPFRDELTTTPLQRGAKRMLDRLAGAYWRLVQPFV